MGLVDALDGDAVAAGGVCAHEALSEAGVRRDDVERMERDVDRVVDSVDVEQELGAVLRDTGDLWFPLGDQVLEIDPSEGVSVGVSIREHRAGDEFKRAEQRIGCVVRRLVGGSLDAQIEPRGRPLPLKRKVTSTIGLAELVPVNCAAGVAEPLASGYLSLESLARSDGWIVVPAESEGFAAGTPVAVRSWP